MKKVYLLIALMSLFGCGTTEKASRTDIVETESVDAVYNETGVSKSIVEKESMKTTDSKNVWTTVRDYWDDENSKLTRETQTILFDTERADSNGVCPILSISTETEVLERSAGKGSREASTGTTSERVDEVCVESKTANDSLSSCATIAKTNNTEIHSETEKTRTETRVPLHIAFGVFSLALLVLAVLAYRVFSKYRARN